MYPAAKLPWLSRSQSTAYVHQRTPTSRPIQAGDASTEVAPPPPPPPPPALAGEGGGGDDDGYGFFDEVDSPAS